MSKLTGNRCQCTACGEYFNGVQPFDRHRVGGFAGGGQRDTRRCSTIAEMEAREWARNAKGFWTTETGAQRASRRRANGFPAPRGTPLMQHHYPNPSAPESARAGSP